MKVCTKCNIEKLFDDFYIHGVAKRSGWLIYFSACKKCSNARSMARFRNMTPSEKKAEYDKRTSRYSKRVRKNWSLKEKFGITIDQYEQMIVDQDSKCYICEDLLIKPHVDHCHKTNRVRKLLCVRCNTGLGSLRDDVSIMEKCIAYIKEHNDNL